MLLKACVYYFLTNFYFSPTDSSSETMKDKKNFIAPFYGWTSTASRLEPL